MSSRRLHSIDSDQPSRAQPGARRSPVEAFDHWLRRQLRRIYRGGVDDPVPTHLQDLVDRFPARGERKTAARDDEEKTEPRG
jgi:hypothetical protein